MRKFIYLLAIVAANFVGSKTVRAQDTTSLRFAAFSDGGELILFKNDSSNLYYQPLSALSSFNALFHHPSTGQLYCLYDSIQGGGDRYFYQIDPFSGDLTRIFAPSASYLAAACVGPNGIVYGITGNGNGAPGFIYQFDIFNGAENLFTTTDLTFGGGFQIGANISYYPPTNELWIFGGAADSLIKINVGSQIETREAVNLNQDGAIKATYLDGNTFWLGSDMSYTLDATTAIGVVASTFSLPDYMTDLEKLDMIEGGDSIAICGSDSAVLRSRFRFEDYKWYYNGQPHSSQTRSISTALPGTYRLLAQFDNGNVFMWSEEIEVVLRSSPTAYFGQSSSNVGVGDLVAFSDSSLFANVYAWDFGDGGSSGLQNPSHSYASPGTYTVTLTVSNGLCTSSYSSSVTVTLVGIEAGRSRWTGEISSIAPNPTAGPCTIEVSMPESTLGQIELLDLQGRLITKLFDGHLVLGSQRIDIDLNETTMKAGFYFLRLSSPNGVHTAGIVYLP